LPPRPSPRYRVWRTALVAVLAGLSLGAASGRAQQAPLDLRAGADAGALTPGPMAQPDAFAPPPESTKQKVKKRRPKPSANALPPLQIYPGAQRLGARGGPPGQRPDATPAPTIAAAPAGPARRRVLADDKPFEPAGVMAGDLRLTPYVEQDLGSASNPLLVAGKAKSSLFESSEAGLGLQSDWATSDLHGNLRGGYADYFSQRAANAPFGNGVLDGRLDVTRDFFLDAEGRFNVATQTPGSITLPSGAVLAGNKRPLVETYGVTLGGAQKFGDLTLSLHGSLDRTNYQNATLADGTIDNLSSDNFDDWTLRARAAWQASPVIAPFVEASVDARRYDSGVDAGGFARNSNGVAGRGGVTFSLTNQLTGEASAGYGARNYRDARLPDLRGPLIDAALIWSATPLTTITLKTSTALADTTTAGASGAFARSYSVEASHALLRNLTLGASVGYATNQYAGLALHDATVSLGVSAEYSVTRDVMLRASATQSRFTTSTPNANYIANVFMLGLRLQR